MDGFLTLRTDADGKQKIVVQRAGHPTLEESVAEVNRLLQQIASTHGPNHPTDAEWQRKHTPTKIRIKPVGEKSFHAWYAAHVGEEFVVTDQDAPYHYTVDISHLGYTDHKSAFVTKSDAEIVEEN